MVAYGFGSFPEFEKYFSEAVISRKIPEIPQEERFSGSEEPEKCNSIPPAIPDRTEFYVLM